MHPIISHSRALCASLHQCLYTRRGGAVLHPCSPALLCPLITNQQWQSFMNRHSFERPSCCAQFLPAYGPAFLGLRLQPQERRSGGGRSKEWKPSANFPVRSVVDVDILRAPLAAFFLAVARIPCLPAEQPAAVRKSSHLRVSRQTYRRKNHWSGNLSQRSRRKVPPYERYIRSVDWLVPWLVDMMLH